MIEIRPFEEKYLDEAYAIEEDSFSIPWSKGELRKELSNNLARYYVAVDDGDGREPEEVVGYAGLWHVVTEGHITNVAVKPERRREGIGTRLMAQLIMYAKEYEMIGLTLEVRIGNTGAQKLYTALGFKPEGIRKNFYSAPTEDAIVMWKYFL